MENRKLTVKQKKFSDEFIKTGNATLSAERAGYSKKTARFIGAENLTKPNIKNYIDEKMKEIEDKEIAKAEEVLKYLTSLMRGQEKEETLIGLGQGEQKIAEIDVSAKDRIRAAELIGRRYALFTDKVDVDGNVGAIIIDDVPDTNE